MHPAEKVLCDEVRAAPEEITILALGPLTNIARAIQRDSTFAAGVGRLDHRRRHASRGRAMSRRRPSSICIAIRFRPERCCARG